MTARTRGFTRVVNGIQYTFRPSVLTVIADRAVRYAPPNARASHFVQAVTKIYNMKQFNANDAKPCFYCLAGPVRDGHRVHYDVRAAADRDPATVTVGAGFKGYAFLLKTSVT